MHSKCTLVVFKWFMSCTHNKVANKSITSTCVSKVTLTHWFINTWFSLLKPHWALAHPQKHFSSMQGSRRIVTQAQGFGVPWIILYLGCDWFSLWNVMVILKDLWTLWYDVLVVEVNVNLMIFWGLYFCKNDLNCKHKDCT